MSTANHAPTELITSDVSVRAAQLNGRWKHSADETGAFAMDISHLPYHDVGLLQPLWQSTASEVRLCLASTTARLSLSGL